MNSDRVDRVDKVYLYNGPTVVDIVAMEQSTETGGNGTATGPGDPQAGAASAAMTYANLETLTRLNTEDLTSILSSTGHHAHHHHHRHEDEEEEDGTHYADASANGEGGEPAGYIVTTASEAYHQGAYVVTAAPSADNDNTNNDGGLDDQSTTDNEASGLSVHSYCKPSNTQETVEGRPTAGSSDVVPARASTGNAATAAELLDLKTVLPGPTTRRVLLIDDGHGDLEMAKSDVEFLLRGDAAGIVLREGKRSEVWARFGKVTFQGRKVKGYVACIYCRQVYAFGDAHSTGTSTLKKHRCLAQSLVTTAGTSPLTPTGGSDRLMPSPAPGSSSQQTDQQNTSYVNFPSPSVIVSIATAVRSNSETADNGGIQQSSSSSSSTTTSPASANIITRYLAPSDRDELIRNAGVVLGSGPISAASFLQLSKALVELGAKHGVALVDDLTAIFNSPTFETVLPGIAHEYRNHFTEEARSGSGGIGLTVVVQPCMGVRLIGVTLGISYCVDSNQNGTTNSPFLRQAPLRHVQLSMDQETYVRIGQLVQRTLKEERLDHLRRAIVCNSTEVIKEVFTGQMAVPCAQSLIGRILALAHADCSSARHDWRQFRETIQRMANIVQTMGWESQLAKAVRPVGGDEEKDASAGLEWMELVINTSSLIGELYKLFQDPSVSAVWNQLDRQLLGHLAAFYSSMASVLAKVANQNSCPTLCNVLLARSHVVSLCTPKCQVDPPALSALKHSVLDALNRYWPLELVHRLACVLHPAFKHMRRLDVSDRERMETYAMVRNLLRQTDSQPVSEHILRNALENSMTGNRNGDMKRKMGRTSSVNETGNAPKRQRSSMSSMSIVSSNPNASSTPVSNDVAFDFSELADFSWHCDVPGASNSGGASNGTLVPEQRDELDLYLEEKVIQQDLIELTNVLVYWKHRQSVFPGLSQLAFWLLALPSSSLSVSACSTSKSDAVLHRQLFQVVAQSSSSPTIVE